MTSDFRSENYTPAIPDSEDIQDRVLEEQRDTSPDVSDSESGEVRNPFTKEKEPDPSKVEPVKHNPHFWENLRKK
jgi:hypothetical protein